MANHDEHQVLEHVAGLRGGGAGARHSGRRGGFIKGPISLDWIAAAARLPGSALKVALLLCYRAGMEGTRRIRITRSDLQRFGLKRNAKNRALAALEQAGLVVVERGPGRLPLVSLVAQSPVVGNPSAPGPSLTPGAAGTIR